ncbi:MAG: hypothetical protein IIY21_04065 [Clostridiales bacterium]|nr:hypothetical protein [Clostridiales bacterium]
MTREEAISINSMVETIATKVTEDTEKFIFETITPYCEEITKREISKKDLERALTQYFSKEPCDDAIDRAEAMTEIMMFAGNVKPDEEDIYIKVSDAVQLLRELPSVTQKSETVTEFADRCRECGAKYGKLLKQKSGKWIETEYHRWRCSVCREKGMSEWDNIHDVRTNFCPDCGADMRGAE